MSDADLTQRAPAVRILVVDDDRAAVDGLSTLLSLDGYEVVGHTSSLRALELLDRDRFDAIITDLEMPGAHGVELVKKVRLVDPSIPVLVVTAYDHSTVSRRAIDEGAWCVLGKPVRYEDLVRELKSALGAPPD